MPQGRGQGRMTLGSGFFAAVNFTNVTRCVKAILTTDRWRQFSETCRDFGAVVLNERFIADPLISANVRVVCRNRRRQAAEQIANTKDGGIYLGREYHVGQSPHIRNWEIACFAAEVILGGLFWSS